MSIQFKTLTVLVLVSVCVCVGAVAGGGCGIGSLQLFPISIITTGEKWVAFARYFWISAHAKSHKSIRSAGDKQCRFSFVLFISFVARVQLSNLFFLSFHGFPSSHSHGPPTLAYRRYCWIGGVIARYVGLKLPEGFKTILVHKYW